MSLLEKFKCPVSGDFLIAGSIVEVPYNSRGNKIAIRKSCLSKYGLSRTAKVVVETGMKRTKVGREDETIRLYSPKEVENYLAERYPLLAIMGK